MKYTWEAWKSVEVLNCEFLQATGSCDGVAIDTDRVSSATISNCTFDHCTSQKPQQGGVVIVRTATTDCQIYDCHFIANSCQNQTLSLRLMVTSSITITGCSFSNHIGSFPVLKADGDGALLSVCDCCFEDNILDAGRTGIIAFPEGKSASLIHCQFLNNQATVTLSKCSKFSFDSCYFLVSPGKAFYPIIRDNGTPKIEVTSCGFANMGAEPAGGSFCVRIDNKDCKVTVSRSCFGSSRDSAISGGQQHVTDTVFGEDCQVPDWDPSESAVVPDPESESEPLGTQASRLRHLSQRILISQQVLLLVGFWEESRLWLLFAALFMVLFAANEKEMGQRYCLRKVSWIKMNLCCCNC